LALLLCRGNIYFALLGDFIYVDGVKAALTKRVTGQKNKYGFAFGKYIKQSFFKIAD